MAPVPRTPAKREADTRVYFLNDTSKWHAGSAAAVQSLMTRIRAAGHEIVCVTRRLQPANLEIIPECDCLIINGEGTFRTVGLTCEPGRIEGLMRAMARAKELGKRVYLVNLVWSGLGPEWGPILASLDGISVREPESACQVRAISGRMPEVHPDEAYFADVPLPKRPLPLVETVVGTIHPANMTDGTDHTFGFLKRLPSFTLWTNTWEEVVNGLRGASLYITGEHHGVIAACKARCSFVHTRINTHKITGLFTWAGVDIPIANSYDEIMAIWPWAVGHREVYERLFDFMEQQTPWPIPV